MNNTAIDFNAGIEWLKRRGFHDNFDNEDFTLVWKSKTKFARKINEFQTWHEEIIHAQIHVEVVRKADESGKIGFRSYAFWANHDNTQRGHGGVPYGDNIHDNVIDALLEVRNTIDEAFAKIEEVDYKRKRSHTDCIKSNQRWLDKMFPAFENWFFDGGKYLESQGYKYYKYHGYIFIRDSKDGHARFSITMDDVRKDVARGKVGWRPSIYYGEEDEYRGRKITRGHQIFINVHDALKSIKHLVKAGNDFVDRYEKKHQK